MEVKFCRRCGAKLEDKDQGAYYCQNGHNIYYKSFPASGVLLVNDQDQVLLTVRGIEPGKGMLDIPGGFCNYAEDYLAAAHRELSEELGLTPDDYSQLKYLMNGIDYYDYEGETEPVINCIYWAHIKQSANIQVADDVAGIEWTKLDAVDFSRVPSTFRTIKLAIPALQKLLA